MAKLFSAIKSELGVEKHQIANESLTANFFYGSRDRSIHALNVVLVVVPDPKGTPLCPEKVMVNTMFVGPDPKRIVHTHTEEFPLCKTEITPVTRREFPPLPMVRK